VEQLESEGIIYEPQVLAEDEFNSLLKNADIEKSGQHHGQNTNTPSQAMHNSQDIGSYVHAFGNDQEKISMQNIERLHTEKSFNMSNTDNALMLETVEQMQMNFQEMGGRGANGHQNTDSNHALSNEENTIELMGITNEECNTDYNAFLYT
jgi:hypothetical protein